MVTLGASIVKGWVHLFWSIYKTVKGYFISCLNAKIFTKGSILTCNSFSQCYFFCSTTVCFTFDYRDWKQNFLFNITFLQMPTWTMLSVTVHRSITDCNGLRICEMLLIDCIASGFVLELCCHLFLQTRHLFLSHAIKTQQNCQLCRLVEWRQRKYIQQGIQRKTFIFFLENLQSCFSSLTYQNNNIRTVYLKSWGHFTLKYKSVSLHNSYTMEVPISLL